MYRKALLFIGIFLGLFGSVSAQNTQEHLENYRKDYIKKSAEQFSKSQQDFYAIDLNYSTLATYKLFKKGKIITVPTSGTKNKDYREYAKLSFKIGGKKHTLIVYQPVPVMPLYKNHLFLPIKDLTAPADTYGGGRYLDMEISDFKDGKVILDFNKLYNPYCAFSSGWNCPIPPAKNHLKARIEAGEKKPLRTEEE